MISTMVTMTTSSQLLSAACVVSLILLLAAHELAEPNDESSAQAFRQALLVFSIPLLVVFASIVAMACIKVIEL